MHNKIKHTNKMIMQSKKIKSGTLDCDIVFFSKGEGLYGWPIDEGRSLMIENLI